MSAVAERDLYIEIQFRGGATLEAIGSSYGITRERVRQILARDGLTRFDGGVHVAAASRAESRQRQREQRFFQKWGHDRQAHRRIPMAARIAFSQQQSHMKNWFHVPWTLTLAEWWDIWQRSGKWNQRGQGRGKFCLARIDKAKPFEVGNVAVVEYALNSQRTQQQRWSENNMG